MENSKKIVYSPSPGAYAVVRLAPLEMVNGFGDLVATEHAMALQTKPYLVYLLKEMSLPFPDQPWYQFTVSPIATCLPPDDPSKGLTPDLCIPIFPNTTISKNAPAA
ncbi:hypothetical protein FKP32DRAFT_1578886 [Trametes sanguinea]|nr:hypothetical protein FKP32DRAFT_1578886 [Trametes sanguinea]